MKEWTGEERQSLRERVDEKLAELGHPPIASADFTFALSREWASDLDEEVYGEEDLIADIAFRVVEWTERDRRTYSPRRPGQMIALGDGREFPSTPTGPSWWAEESSRRFERFRKIQAAALSLIGRSPEQFLAIDELHTALASLARKQRTGGELFSLAVPVGADPTAHPPQELRIWRGLSTASDSQEVEEQPLWRLVMLVSHVDAHTGCGEPEALAFLLCDVVPTTPWVGVRYDVQHGAIRLSVRHPRVSPTDVAVAYSSVRDAFFGKKRRGSEWPYVARGFCKRLKEDGGWEDYSDAFALFRRKHRDQPYKNYHSFYQAVHDLQKRLGETT